jgi:hypothetical protein
MHVCIAESSFGGVFPELLLFWTTAWTVSMDAKIKINTKANGFFMMPSFLGLCTSEIEISECWYKERERLIGS